MTLKTLPCQKNLCFYCELSVYYAKKIYYNSIRHIKLKRRFLIMQNKKNYLQGLRDGTPISLGYFAVGFTLGIAAKAMGLTAFQAGLMSATMHASAGEFAVLTVIAGQSGYLSMIITQLVINMRYFLMACSLSQKIDRDTSLPKRLLLGYFVTDEIFGISVSKKEPLNPFYNFGAATIASPGWILGTVLGAAIGNILPGSLSSALSVALYGMFLAVVIPPSKKDKTIAAVVVISMIGSLGFSMMPVIKDFAASTRIIILTIVIASIAAIVRPVDDRQLDEAETHEELGQKLEEDEEEVRQ